MGIKYWNLRQAGEISLQSIRHQVYESRVLGMLVLGCVSTKQ